MNAICAPSQAHAIGSLFPPTADELGRDDFDMLDADRVCFLPGGLFEFVRDLREPGEIKDVAIIPRRDEFGTPIDLAAWDLGTGNIATLRGRAVMLGEEEVFAPRVEHDGLHVFPNPAEWLRARRRGVVILNPKRARWRLAEHKLVVSDAAFGRRLRHLLRLPEPRRLSGYVGQMQQEPTASRASNPGQAANAHVSNEQRL